MENQVEIWKSHPEYTGIEVSTFGRVRTLDKVVSSEKRTQFVKRRVLKQSYCSSGYLQVGVSIDGKRVTKLVHRLIAQAFIPNPEELPQINHKDSDPTNNNVSNLEWCTPKYNSQYREKYGVSRMEVAGKPVFAINLSTLEVTHFQSQSEAGQALGASTGSINMVIKGSRNQAGGYLFKEDDGNGIEIDNDKLNDIADSMPFTGGIFAVNLNTSEVSRFESQTEASRLLGIDNSTITKVTKGSRNQTGGYWFVNDDGKADDAIKCKLQEIKKIYSQCFTDKCIMIIIVT